MLGSAQGLQKSAALALFLMLAPAANAEFGEGELTRSSAPLAAYYLVPQKDAIAPVRRNMEEMVVTAPRQERSWKLRRSVSEFFVDQPGGLDWQWLPAYDPEQRLALEERRMRERPVSEQFEPAGGMELFRITLDR